MLDYMCMAFLLLGLTDTLRYWSSIYFVGHIFIFTFIAVGYVIRMKQSSVGKGGDLSKRSAQLPEEATGDTASVTGVKED